MRLTYASTIQLCGVQNTLDDALRRCVCVYLLTNHEAPTFGRSNASSKSRSARKSGLRGQGAGRQRRRRNDDDNQVRSDLANALQYIDLGIERIQHAAGVFCRP